MDAAPGTPGAPSIDASPIGGAVPDTMSGATAAPSGGATPTGLAGAAAPADSASQVVANDAGWTTGRTTTMTPEAIVPITNAHSMRTRGKDGFWQLVDRLNLHMTAAATTLVPSSVRAALLDPAWRLAMQAEFDALQANDTWTLVPRPPGVNLVTGKWVFRHKFKSDGSLDRYKARWVLCGFTQRPNGTHFGTVSLLADSPA